MQGAVFRWLGAVCLLGAVSPACSPANATGPDAGGADAATISDGGADVASNAHDSGPASAADAATAASDSGLGDGASSSEGGASPCGTSIPPASEIIDSQGNVWTLTSGAQIARNGVVDPITKSVVQLLYLGEVVHQNAFGLWWAWVNGAWQSENKPTASCTSLPGDAGTGNGNALVGVYMDPPDNPTWSSFMGSAPNYSVGNSYMTVLNSGSDPCNALNNNGNGGYPTVIAVGHFDSTTSGENDPVAAANGSYNSVYADYAANAIGPCASTIYAVRIDWEWAGNWFPFSPYYSPGSYGSPYITASDWIAGFRNLVAAIRANPTTAHIKISWDYPTLSQGANAFDYYPGDDYVDIISTDYYFSTQYDGPTSAGSWSKATGTQGIDDWATFAAAHNKPMAAWEWCDMYLDGYNITQFSNWMKGHNVVAHSYWDSDDAIASGNTCKLQDNATRQNAYIAAWQNWAPSGTFWSGLIPIPGSAPPGF
jgi:hypothetical protein